MKETTQTVKLTAPITRGEKQITEITILKPTVPALKGLKMMDVLQMDANAMQALLPRITQPVLHKNDFQTMETSDFFELSSVAINFLIGNSAEETPTE